MFNTPCQGYQRQPFWNKLVAIVALVGVPGVFSVHAEPAHAAATLPPIVPISRPTTAYHPTAAAH